MTRSARLLLLVHCAALLLASCDRQRTRSGFEGAPVILISIDTLRADHLALYGYSKVETPNIDALGGDGILVRTPIEEVRKWSADFATMLEWFDRVGYDADIASLEKRFGIRPTRLERWAQSMSWAEAA